MTDALSGGCQCGAVRFSAAAPLGRPSICHCRMCQKAFAAPYGALISAASGLTWTRGAPTYFQSSNRVRRGFCSRCGTPLTFEPDSSPVEVAIVAFDDPGALAPVIQMARERRLPWTEQTGGLRGRTAEEEARVAGHYASIVSYQHPDHDTDRWPSEGRS